MTTPKMDNENIERLIDIIGDGDLTAEAQERLQQEGLWPLYESVRQMAYTALRSHPGKHHDLDQHHSNNFQPVSGHV